jgi:DNA polymerase-3 subunit epsilon
MNLANRIRAHFTGESRSTRDRRIAGDAARIDWKPTAGELGAIFRHAQWVDRLAPQFNRKPVKRSGYCSLQWDAVGSPQIPAFVDMDDPDFRGGTPLYGLFRSRKVATNALRDLADAHGLCHIAIGIETGMGPCLGHRLKHCRGLCVGHESPIAHAMRMTQALHALRLPAWPFPGAIGVRESDAASGRREIHVFDHWRRLGSYEDHADLEEGLRARREGAFDYETWRLLRRYLADLPPGTDIIPLAP